MKKVILLFTVLLCAVEFVQAQRPVLYRDGKELNLSEQVKYGDILTFKLCDVNPFYYNVEINASSRTYDYADKENLFNDYLKLSLKDIPGNNLKVMGADSLTTKQETFKFAVTFDSFKKQFYLVMKEARKLNQLDELDIALRSLVMTDKPLDYGKIEHKRDQIVKGILGIGLSDGEPDYSALLRNYFSGTYIRLKEYLSSLSIEYAKLSNPEKSIVADQKKIVDTLILELDKNKFDEKLESVNKLYREIRNDAFCVSKTIAVPRKADEIKFVYTIKEKNNQKKESELNIIVKDSVTVLVRKRFNLNVSTGGILTWLGDYEYTTKSIGTDEGFVQQIALKTSGKVEFATGALAHIYATYKPNFSPGLSLGLALNGDNELRYLAGFSAIFGREQRIVVTGGVAAGETDRLAENQYIGQEVASFDDVQVVSSIKAKGFVGLTYNF